MKKLFKPLAVAMVVLAGFYSCKLLNYPANRVIQNSTVCCDYSGNPVNEMDKQMVLDMISNYYSKQYAAINGGSFNFDGNIPATVVNEDSRAVFFELGTLKKLLYYIDKASENFSIADKQNLGVNIYFASYPAPMQMQKNGYDYTNRHTVIFLPAIFDNTTHTACDFDLRRSLDGINTTKPNYITDSFLMATPTLTALGFSNAPSGSTTTPVNSMSAQNHGTAIPPPPSSAGNVILNKTDPN